jgi:lipopolysaccharide transport system permease protein
VALLGLGFGMIVTSITTKYRDLVILLNFGIQLLMYATAVAYPLSSLTGKMYFLVRLNPLTCIIEAFRKCTLDKGLLNIYSLLYSITFTIVILFLGFIVFNKAEKDFIDTV